jgi:hypothetical protein
MARDPVVFISSTLDDLKDHREQAAKAARAMGFSARMMEDFPAAGHAPSLKYCLEKVDEAEVVVVLVAHRYGWVPEDASNPDNKSITWLECDHARQAGLWPLQWQRLDRRFLARTRGSTAPRCASRVTGQRTG